MDTLQLLTADDVRRIVREELGRGACAVFSQVDGERPPGCGRAKYLRVWRLAREAGDPGATSRGKARLLTESAYASFEAKLPRGKRQDPARARLLAVWRLARAENHPGATTEGRRRVLSPEAYVLFEPRLSKKPRPPLVACPAPAAMEARMLEKFGAKRVGR